MQIKQHGRAQVARAIDLQLVRLAGMMNVKHNLTPPQITTIVYDLLEKFPYETLEDFLLVFKRMRQGYYGQSYHLLSEATIMACMEIHLEEKWSHHERQLQKQKDEEKKQETGVMSESDLHKAYAKIKAQGGFDASKKENEAEDKDSHYKKWRLSFLHNRKKNDVDYQIEMLNHDQIKTGIEEDRSGGTDDSSSSHEQA